MSLRHVILTLISQEPQTGYEIVKSFDKSVGYFWQASHQQVYRELGTLFDKGWVSYKLKQQIDRPDKKTYYLREQGAIELVRWLETPLTPPVNKDALLVKLMGIDYTDSNVLLNELKESQNHTKHILDNYLAIEKQYYSVLPDEHWPRRQQMLYLALRKGILGAKSRLKWLEEALTLIRSMIN